MGRFRGEVLGSMGSVVVFILRVCGLKFLLNFYSKIHQFISGLGVHGERDLTFEISLKPNNEVVEGYLL